MPGAQKLRNVAAIHESPLLRMRCNDEVEAQSRSERDRWTFYETIIIHISRPDTLTPKGFLSNMAGAVDNKMSGGTDMRAGWP